MPIKDNIFWVKCPRCGRRFYCDRELRNSDIKLWCPFCRNKFLEKESPEIFDRK